MWDPARSAFAIDAREVGASPGEKPLAEGIAEERRAVLATMGTADQREGIQAFLEKRKPRFNRGAE